MASSGATGAFTMRNLQTFDSNNIIALVFALGLSFGIFALFSRSEVEEEREDGKEPPEIRSRIPYIGHLIGLLSYQVGYFQKLRYVEVSFSPDLAPPQHSQKRACKYHASLAIAISHVPVNSMI